MTQIIDIEHIRRAFGYLWYPATLEDLISLLKEQKVTQRAYEYAVDIQPAYYPYLPEELQYNTEFMCSYFKCRHNNPLPEPIKHNRRLILFFLIEFNRYYDQSDSNGHCNIIFDLLDIVFTIYQHDLEIVNSALFNIMVLLLPDRIDHVTIYYKKFPVYPLIDVHSQIAHDFGDRDAYCKINVFVFLRKYLSDINYHDFSWTQLKNKNATHITETQPLLRKIRPWHPDTIFSYV